MGQQDLPISELVAMIERGAIRLPEMQRQYVWRSTRVRDLLDSLYRGYPSGTILTWETDEPVATRDFSVEQDCTGGNRYQLLLDGQQRLTSLSAVIRGNHVKVAGRVKPIDILFNLNHPDALEVVTEVLEDEDSDSETDGDDTDDASEDDLLKRFDKMAFVVSSNKIAALPHWISVTEVFKDSSESRFLKEAGVTEMNDPRYEKYAARIKKLRSIKEYSYRVHVLDRDKSYEEVTEIFVRVNSLGAKLRSSDLALAKITATWRDSLKIFQEFEAECKALGFDIGMALHLKNLMAFATGQSRFKVVSRLSKELLEDSWKLSKEGMLFAINFLKSNAGVESPALLASPFMIITLAYYGHKKDYDLSQDEASQLRHWALLANAKARYSRGSSETFLDQDLVAIRNGHGVDGLLQLLEKQVGRLYVLPSDLEGRSSRSAYFKTMFLAFKESGATDWRGQLSISLKHSGTAHLIQFHHIFPQALLKKVEIPPQKINDICNLAFIGGKTNRTISDKSPIEYLPAVIEKSGIQALASQSIPSDSALWEPAAYDVFLQRRREAIAARLNEFLGMAKQDKQEAA